MSPVSSSPTCRRPGCLVCGAKVCSYSAADRTPATAASRRSTSGFSTAARSRTTTFVSRTSRTAPCWRFESCIWLWKMRANQLEDTTVCSRTRTAPFCLAISFWSQPPVSTAFSNSLPFTLWAAFFVMLASHWIVCNSLISFAISSDPFESISGPFGSIACSERGGCTLAGSARWARSARVFQAGTSSNLADASTVHGQMSRTQCHLEFIENSVLCFRRPSS